ncbi:Suppressor of tumorigenicity 14 protein [Merluccius polli]|uniref:Suppressor of tumorigenicity 14 protein n=1 Tax=Merluccius polli TaxID=89951 RepID=A0AA47N309_MERPO|nr:Suppressor of tumorigenicity 14 protein [Merluccius polli]
MEEICGYYSPSDPLSFLSSRNVMLVTLVTSEKGNYPGIRAHVSQVLKGGAGMKCGGKIVGPQGAFMTPNFPNYYPPNTECEWKIEVPAGKWISVIFSKFLLFEPGQNGKDCTKDYVAVNSKKLCGEKVGQVAETISSNVATIRFVSDRSFVDRGFNATFKAIDSLDPCPKMFQCKNQLCMDLKLKCDGWNDCGDMSDELNCKCNESDLQCKNGLCKPMFWQCDGVNDCGDNTDELNCGCKADQFLCLNSACVLKKKRCDGRNDCGDGSDELDCGRTTSTSCSDVTYKCKNQMCINKQNPECDGTRDCADGSDEENCGECSPPPPPSSHLHLHHLHPHTSTISILTPPPSPSSHLHHLYCGQRLLRFKGSRIVGGQDAELGEFPWQVSLHVKAYGHVCGASVISRRWLVTAAHCVQDDGKIKFSQPRTWEAHLGLHTQRMPGKAVVKLGLKQVIPHPYYNAYTYDNDIALMELAGDVAFSDYIQPICLPAAQHVFPSGTTVSITGWGATREGGSAASVLQKAQVRIINATVCNRLMSNQITSRMLCAGILSGGVDACQGDSGGPLSSLASPASEGGRSFLAGVVSWGDGCARRNKPGIYSTVTKFRGWIKEKTGV